MPVACYREVHHVCDRLPSALYGELLSHGQSSDGVHSFDVDDMRRVQRYTLCENPLLDTQADRRTEQYLEHCRSIDDNHLRSRPSRIICAGDTLGSIGVRDASISRNSATDGRSASRFSSRMR